MTPPPVRQVPDIRYAAIPGYRPLELDLYLPQSSEPLPVIVDVHGGGWRRGGGGAPPARVGGGAE
jgi:acetyl esterase/lipase